MTDYSEVQVTPDAKNDLTIRLVGDPRMNVDDAVLTIPDYLLGEFRDQIKQVFGV